MLGTFLGLEIAKRGLQTQQAAIEVTAHNISNANTPGYTRQRVDLVATQPLEVPGLTSAIPGQVGTGVQVDKIERLRDDYLDTQYRQQNSYLGSWQAQQDALQKVTAILNEPSDTGLSTVMQNFWNAWDKLSSNPNDLAARNLVVQTSVTVAQTLNQTANQLSQLQDDLNASLSATVDQVNSYLTQIARLNQQIDSVLDDGKQPNDLMDQRDYLIDQLSNLADVSVQTDTAGRITLSIGGQVVLDDQTVTPDPSDSSKPLLQVTTDTTNPNYPLTIGVTSGKLQGLVAALNTVKSYQSDLDAFAYSLADGPITVTLAGNWTIYADATGTATLPVDIQIGSDKYPASTRLADVAKDHPELGIAIDPVSGDATIPQGKSITVFGLNGLLQMGYDQNGSQGKPLFVINPATTDSNVTAANITVNPAISQDVTTLAASFTKTAGDGTLAMTVSSVKLAQVQFSDPNDATASMPLRQGTFDSFLQAVVGQLGIQGQQADQQVSNQQALVQQIDMQRQSVTGVSLNEEMSNLIQYQQAFNASAKVVQAVNDLLTTLINSVR
ncbi:flagellar hook-associated protein FlgK [Alicyclobacillus macrosporangiidus]|uniref:Flagellar hook-associated protein 1 n=1 Tax=Alicyclobacillus macrosporangiidus TaxID=392015 RepID=A0A1I7L6A0_9BACL|nr:flagellar hook-associated protein FlgK [Alicyclobacillus macrosporangiidus]SFV05210.1 flagellar hook-associated protein 1 FlgK [Alicyclobacillus macrosporangiidus]